MGKQSRRKRERSPGEARTHRYFGRLGLPDRPDPLPYRRIAEADREWYGRVCAADDAALALADKADADPDEILAATRARYELVYRDLDTALAEYAWRPVMIGNAWLPWWYEQHSGASPASQGPRRLLDLGCGPGVLTCAYGLALPDSEVVGIDAVPEAVACAEELARRVGAGNVSFVVGDFLDPAVGGDGFDEVVAVTALGDAGLYPLDPPDDREALSSVADVDGPGLEYRSAGVEGVAARLVPGGSLLVFDRTPDPSQAVRLGAALIHAGIDLDLRRAGVELFVEEGHATTFTRLAGVMAERAPTSGGDLAAWIKGAPAPAYGPMWQQEVRFEGLKASGARLVWGCEIDYAPLSPIVERREIWEHAGDAYGWVTTTVRVRDLIEGRTAESLWQEYGGWAGRVAASGSRVRFYDKDRF